MCRCLLSVRTSQITLLLVLGLALAASADAQTNVTLQVSTSPTSGEPGVATIFVTGSGFPTGTVAAASTTVKLLPSGGGSSQTTTALSATFVVGSSWRIGFKIPTSISVSSPTAYLVSISGRTSTGNAFTSTNAKLTVNPSASIASIDPSSARAGSTQSVVITGNFTSFVQGTTKASFGAGISVGGAAEGTQGAVKVNSTTSATASIVINPEAGVGSRDVQVVTGTQNATALGGFNVLPANHVPVANAGGPYTANVNEDIHFSGAGSTDEDNDPLTYSWDFGDGATGTGVAPTHHYSVANTYTVSLQVQDPSGAKNTATTTATISASADKTPPVVTITSPHSGDLFHDVQLTVTGTVDDPTASVSVNGVAASLASGIFTATAVPLRQGRNVLTVTATDPGGNAGVATTSVDLDTEAPVIHIDTPGDGAMLSSTQVTVAGMVNDMVTGTVNAEQATVTVNGIAATVSNRSFVAPDILLNPGMNKSRAVARDRAGNEAASEVTVQVQDSAVQQTIQIVSGNNQTGAIGSLLSDPLVVRLADANGLALAGRQVTFSVSRSDGSLQVFPDEGREFTVKSDDDGRASVLFRLGTRVGVGINEVQVTSPGFVGQAVFSASSTVGSASKLNAVSGENQRGLLGQTLPQALIVIATDSEGNPVSGVPVEFKITTGDGNVEGLGTLAKNTDSDGKAGAVLQLGSAPGNNSDAVTVSLVGVTSPPIVFLASALTPGPAADTTVSGLVLDNTENPIPNATAKIIDTQLSAVTDQFGKFTIRNVSVGTVGLLIDGSTSTRAETFPTLSFSLVTLPGQDNTLGFDIHLPPIDTENTKVAGADEEVVLTMKGVPGVAFTVFPHSATFPDGSHVGRLGLSQVHADKVPMPPPNGTIPRIVWTLQPPGVHFDPPVRVQLPNADGLAPGKVLEIFQYDHDLEQFVSVGPARVSPDGSVIVTDEGFGITKSGWGGGPPPPPPNTCVASCDDGNSCTSDACQGGACVNTPTSGGCDDHNDCTVNDHCSGAACMGDPKKVTSVDGKANGKDHTGWPLNKPLPFTATAQHMNCPEVEYEWDFGDGTKANGASVSHTYTMQQTYNVVVTAKCKTCNTVTDNINVVITPDIHITSVTPQPVMLGDDLMVNYEITGPMGSAFDSVRLEISNKSKVLVFKQEGLPGAAGTFNGTWSKIKWTEAPNAGAFANPNNGPYEVKIIGVKNGEETDDKSTAMVKLVIEADFKDAVQAGSSSTKPAGLSDVLTAFRLIMRLGASDTVVAGAGAITITPLAAVAGEDNQHVKVDSPILNALADGMYDVVFMDLRDDIGNFSDMDGNAANGIQPFKFPLNLR